MHASSTKILNNIRQTIMGPKDNERPKLIWTVQPSTGLKDYVGQLNNM